jgi:hypothetical protein
MPAPKGNKNAKGNRGGGRKSLFKPEYVEMARRIALLGATNVELAGVFGVSESTIESWTRDRVEFAKALKAGKTVADSEVANRLYRRALGYSHKAVKIFADPKTGDELVVPFTQHYAPDTTACIFWLKNRRPMEWRDRQLVDVIVTPGTGVLAVPVTDAKQWASAARVQQTELAQRIPVIDPATAS